MPGMSRTAALGARGYAARNNQILCNAHHVHNWLMHSFLADIDFGTCAFVALVSFAAALVGGVTGYGTGLLLPPVLLPIVGPHYVVPIISLSAILTNGSRLTAFFSDLDRPNRSRFQHAWV